MNPAPGVAEIVRQRSPRIVGQSRWRRRGVEPPECEVAPVTQLRIAAACGAPDRRCVRFRLKFIQQVVDHLEFGEEPTALFVRLRPIHAINVPSCAPAIPHRRVKIHAGRTEAPDAGTVGELFGWSAHHQRRIAPE